MEQWCQICFLSSIFGGAFISGRHSALRNRLMLHAAHKLGDVAMKERCMKALDSSIQDQMSLAAVRFAERDYGDAVNIYSHILSKNK